MDKSGPFVHAEMARKLERERDELIDHLESEKITRNAVIDKLGKAIKERDDAIADRDIARLATLESDKAHDRMVGELEKVYKERDEAQRACQLAHDRLLRGDNDREILDILAKGWRAAK